MNCHVAVFDHSCFFSSHSSQPQCTSVCPTNSAWLPLPPWLPLQPPARPLGSLLVLPGLCSPPAARPLRMLLRRWPPPRLFRAPLAPFFARPRWPLLGSVAAARPARPHSQRQQRRQPPWPPAPGGQRQNSGPSAVCHTALAQRPKTTGKATPRSEKQAPHGPDVSVRVP